MILINSIAEDYSTNHVIDWLVNSDNEVLRVNFESKISDIRFVFNDDELDVAFMVDNQLCLLSKVKAFWFRRGQLNFNNFLGDGNLPENLGKKIYSHLINEELKTIEEFIIYCLEGKRKLGSYFQGNANKLKSLHIAQEVGLKIPQSVVTSSKNILNNFYKQNHSTISKGVQDIMSFVDNEKSCSYKTEVVSKADIDEMNETFFPSLLQERVEKLYELRIFYIEGEFYSMAIFSQQDDQTKVDFRDYNRDKPNRTVPYNLPHDIKKALKNFMRKMDLDTGSIDVIVTPKYDYVFLEVNPVGQYGMTSFPCNYFLDEKIAQYLSR